MTWDNPAALHDLFAEAEGLDDGYLTVARILPGRREEQLTSREIGPADELAAAVDLAARHLPSETRVRVRLWRRGGKPVRGVVVRVLGEPETRARAARSASASRPTPSPTTPPATPAISATASCSDCAELHEVIEQQNDRLDEAWDQRDDSEALARRLQRDLASLRGDLDSAVFRAETAERERDNARLSLTQAEERFMSQDAQVSRLKRENRKLRAYVADADEAAERLFALVGT